MQRLTIVCQGRVEYGRGVSSRPGHDAGHAARRRRTFRHRLGRHPLQGADRRAPRPVRQGHAGRRRLHDLQMSVRARRVVPLASRRRQGAGAGRQLRQCQCLHRQDRRGAAAAFTAKLAGAATGAPAKEIFIASTGVIGEPLDATKFEGVFEQLVAAATPDRILDAATAIMTTDTFAKVGVRHGRDRRRSRHDHRHRQGRRHDRARHGDDAVLRLHRCADRRHRPCRPC